jgi:hypothetical protein
MHKKSPRFDECGHESGENKGTGGCIYKVSE